MFESENDNEPPDRIHKGIIAIYVLVILLLGGYYIFTLKPSLEDKYERFNTVSVVGQTALLPIVYPPLGFLEVIIGRESSWITDVCNYEYGCKAGMGLIGLIPSTQKYCEEKLGYKIDPFYSLDNIECGLWLLANEGISHWESEDGSWGSGPYNL